jgi:ABC-type microcin C transport system permease subunit YejE
MLEPAYYFHWAVIHQVCLKGFIKLGDISRAEFHREQAVYYLVKGLKALSLPKAKYIGTTLDGTRYTVPE